MSRTILAKFTVGLRPTHNRDGRYTRCWRLWSDGTIERTNSKSKYQRMRPGETPPAEILSAAKAAGLL